MVGGLDSRTESELDLQEDIIKILRNAGFGYDNLNFAINGAGVRAKLYITKDDVDKDNSSLRCFKPTVSLPFVAIFYDKPPTQYSLENLADAQHLYATCEEAAIPVQEFISGSAADVKLKDFRRVSDLLPRLELLIEMAAAEGKE